MSAPALLNVGERTYISVKDDFGVVVRPTFLGLQNAPVVQLDDNTLAGFAGDNALEDVVALSTGKNLKEQAVTVPLDVRLVGIAVMNKMGIPAESQAAMYIAFRSLTKEQRTALTDQWAVAAEGSEEAQAAFVHAMLAQLAPPA